MDDFESKIFDSKCEKDYKNKHFWEKQGVVGDECKAFRIWKCSQCGKVFSEELDFIEMDDEEFKRLKANVYVDKAVDYMLNKTKRGREIYKDHGKYIRNMMITTGLMIWDKAIIEEVKKNK